MDTFVISYLVVWLAVAAYVARMGAEQRRLRRVVRDLEQQAAAPRYREAA